MYFKSLINEELKPFHKIINIKNFSISLSDILESSLFKVDRINETICKIYPLFYCKEITSDDNSKILENKCIITSIAEDEKYFNFISNDDTPVVYDDLLRYYDVGNKISTKYFNAYIQLLRKHMSLVDNIRVDNGLITGVYGEYKFNLDDVTIVDNGILITEETLSANPTVRLINPVFKNSTYILKLDVFSVSDVNIMEEYHSDNITHDTLEIVLEEGVDISLPLGSLEFNRIVNFNATIDIIHDKPIIQLPGHLTLSCETDDYIDTTISFTVVYEDETGMPLNRETLILRDGETTLGTALTNEEGIATFEYLPRQDKEYNFNVVTEEGLISNNIVKNIVKHSVDITLNSDKSIAYIPTTFNINGIVSNDSGVIKNATLDVLDNNQLLETVYSNSAGEYNLEVECNNIANYNLQVVSRSDSINYSGASDYINIVARKYHMNITINTDKTLVYYGNRINVTGKLTNELNEAISGATVKLMNGNTQLDTATTDSNGNYSFNELLSIGNYNLTVVYAGDGSHESITSASKTVTCRKYNTNITINTDKTLVYYSQSVVISGKLTNEFGNAIGGATVKLYNGNSQIITTTTSSNGTYSFTRLWGEGNYQFKVVYDGDISKNSVTSSVKSVTMSKAPTNTTIYVNSTTGTKLGLKIKVSSNYGSFNPSSVDITYNGRTETVTTKDNEGNFIYTTPPVPEGTYNIIAKYNGTVQYATSTASESVEFTIKSDTVLTASYSNGTFTINAKYNGENMPYWMFKGMVLYLSNPQTTMALGDADTITDANGNITISASLGSFHGTAYATYKSLTSNTTSY